MRTYYTSDESSEGSSSFFSTLAIRIIPYRSTGIRMVAAMDAFSIISAHDDPIRAKTRVQAYKITRRTAPIRAKIRFSFCVINPFFCFCLAGTEKGNRNTAVFPQKLSGLYSYSIPELKVYGKHKLVYNEQAGRAILSA